MENLYFSVERQSFRRCLVLRALRNRKPRWVIKNSGNNQASLATLQLLPAMQMNKLNVLHLHLTEDQSFPLMSMKKPELHEKGAFSAMEMLSPGLISLMVKKAEQYGIRIIPEFDMPGHSTSVRLSHPELFACTAEESARGAYDPTK